MRDPIGKPKDTSPSAFPLAVQPDFQFAEPGMSLRDWFAGQALAGLLAHASGDDPHKAPGYAYALADKMLAERSKP